MRRKRIDPKARGLVCAVKRANVIGARDQRTTSGPAGRQNPHRQAEDMTAPTIKRIAAKKPLISGRRPDMTRPLRTTRTVLRSDMESLLTTDFRRLEVVRRIESRVATIDRTSREWDRARMPK